MEFFKKLVIIIGIFLLSEIYVNCNSVLAIEEPIAGMGLVLEESNNNIKPIYTTSNVNVREEPNINSDIINMIDKNTEVLSLDGGNIWSMVLYEGEVGYVSNDYIEEELQSMSVITHDEIEILQRITEAEATGGTIENKENVASSVLNRVMHKDFPDTIKEVVFQNKQYSPVSDGRYWSVEVTKETIVAVDNVINNGTTHDCLYFANMSKVKNKKTKNWFNNNLKFVFKDSSGHSYFKMRGE